jgi:nucleotide-binding universal stress UspA family protein
MKLLVAVDGSQEAEAALAYATDIADATAGSITLAYAVDPNVYEVRGSEPVTDLSDADRRLVLEGVENAESRGLNVLDEASDFAAELGRDVETKLLHGDPVVEIADHAEEAGFDAIVVGHRGRSEHEDRLLGSVAKELVERATVPVTVVR